MPYVVNRANVV